MLQHMEATMKALAKDWWLFILRGVIAIIFGILVVVWPIESVFVLVIFFGAYVLVDGIFVIISAFTQKRSWGSRFWLILWGLVGIAAGVVTFAWPGITALALLVVIAVWAFVIGIAQVVFAFAPGTSLGNRLLLALGGIISIILGIVLVARPGLGALAVVWIIGIFAIVFGMCQIAFGMKLKGLKTEATVKPAS